MKVAKIISVSLIVFLLSACTGEEDLKKIEYLRTSDEISLWFIKEYEECLESMKDFDDFSVEPFVNYVLSEKYRGYIQNLMKCLEEQAELNSAQGVSLEIRDYQRKLVVVQQLVLMKIYAEIINGEWDGSYKVVLQEKEVEYSELLIKKEAINVFKGYEENSKGFQLMMVRMLLMSGNAEFFEEDQPKIERRLKGPDWVYKKMEMPEESGTPPEFKDFNSQIPGSEALDILDLTIE